MEKCEHCGKDHEEEIRKILPEAALLTKASEVVVEKEFDDLFTDAVHTYFSSMVSDNIAPSFRDMQQDGLPPQEAVAAFTSRMMLTGFAVGVALSDEYRDRIPKVTISDEDREAFVEEHWNDAMRSHGENQNNQEQIIELLKKLGIVPEDFEGDISILPMNLGESASGGDDTPNIGNYL